MASIEPFAALRPTADSAAAVSAVPYDVVSTAEARDLAAGNPLSFLHVTRAEIDLPDDTDPYSDRVYQKARENFAIIRDRAPLVLDREPTLYVYRLELSGHTQVGIAGCFSVDEYERDVIRKHERTRRAKEDDRTRHIIELRAQTGIVFLTYQASRAIDRLTGGVTTGIPLYDFTAPDGVHHTVWSAGPDVTGELVEMFRPVATLYLADGHHRAASAARARAELRTRAEGTGDATRADWFLGVAFPHDQVRIQAYNRVVRDLAGRTAGDFLAALRERFAVSSGGATPNAPGRVSMYLDGRWYDLHLTGAEPEDDARASRLDVALLQRHVLEPLLGIGDVRTDLRIDFVGGARGTRTLEQLVDTGGAAVAFSMFPVSVEDLMTVSDEGGIMPPKSTWFEPKLRDGLLTHLI
jgi:uncharacterized protein (DUF1015 family)